MCRVLLIVSLSVAALSQRAVAADPAPIRIRCESLRPGTNPPVRLAGVRLSELTPCDFDTPEKLENLASWRFDGRRSIAYTVPSNTDGFAENFTWEGFFFFTSQNQFLSETGIADRLVSQFAFDKGNWTRLAIGLVADKEGQPRLAVQLEGFEGRSFAQGRHFVDQDCWHHFALVHEGTPSAARISLYLDHVLTGELLLGGQADQNTLRPPGTAPFTIGARLLAGQTVNRGFQGLIDEIRLMPRPLKPDEFLRCKPTLLDELELIRRGPEDPEAEFWRERRWWARKQVKRWAGGIPGPNAAEVLHRPVPTIDDAAFLRRLSLTVRGRIPSLKEVTEFLADDRPDKRSRAIDRMLGSPEWADGWVGYWQDVLAENPSVVFPTLNNSGAFRQWLHDSFRENKPFDRFVTELLRMEGDAGHATSDGPAGFALATGNDVPMAMRAHTAMKAFAAVDLKCARCHDSPVDDFRQQDLFLLAAYLNGGPLEVPATSVTASGKAKNPGILTTSLKVGQTIEPVGLAIHWLRKKGAPRTIHDYEGLPRYQLASLLTAPGNSRFSDVIVNRLWQRLYGTALIELVDNWPDDVNGPNANLLRKLSVEFVNGGYDLKRLARQILNSPSWQSERRTRTTMSAEQLVDSLFLAVGKEFNGETLGVHATDPGAVQLPQPRRAWQFTALPNERDRPALGMPVNQTIVDVLTAFGWNGARQQPRSEREQVRSALQPLLLFNGLMSQRIVRLSERSTVTELCLRDLTVPELVDQLFLTVLSRHPDELERDRFVMFLQPGFATRKTGHPPRPYEPVSTFQPDWRKHLQPEQTRFMLEAQRRVARGELPTARLTDGFRERVEDVLWALINSPEFVVIP